MAWRESVALGKVRAREVSAKVLKTGGDPLNGTPSTAVTATAAELNILDGVTATAAELNKLDGVVDGVGAAAGTGNVVAETMGLLQKTVLTLTDVAVTVTFEVANDSGWGTIKLYDFPAGRIDILGVTADLSFDVSASENVADAGSGDVALGTTQTADVTLAGTDVDLLPSTAMTDPFVAGAGAATGALAASAQLDGTGTAKDLNLNIAFDAGDVTTDDGEVLVSGTVTVHWVNLGDY